MEVLSPGKKNVWQRVGTFSRHDSGPWVIGRSIAGNKASLLNSITEAHFQLLIEPGGQFVIEPLESLNGVYEKLTSQTPYQLVDQCRLIIGDYVIEFRTAEPAAEPATLCSDEGEQFRSTFLSAPARLLVLGPDGEPSVELPLLARRSTIVGRGGPNLEISCDLTLPDENMVLSRAHCEFVQDDGKFFLVDLGSRNGTFLQLDGRTQVNVGDVSAPDQAAQFSVGQFLFRFIDE
jgi:pSer/pThr/pTyr-binding forkhead associated (FHA) protein